jgi:hypothetical protein
VYLGIIPLLLSNFFVKIIPLLIMEFLSGVRHCCYHLSSMVRALSGKEKNMSPNPDVNDEQTD